jgi:hypothetical protein
VVHWWSFGRQHQGESWSRFPCQLTTYKQPDYVLELDFESWAALYSGSTDLERLVTDEKVRLTKGGQKELAGVFDLFDKLDPKRNYKIPPLEE